MDAAPALVARLRFLEEDLLRPEVRRSAQELEARLAPDFVEFGSSGGVFDRAAIISALGAEASAAVRIEGFAVRMLAADVAPATYRSIRAGPPGGSPTSALRASIWRRENGTWRVAFHQGTPAG